MTVWQLIGAVLAACLFVSLAIGLMAFAAVYLQDREDDE